MSSANQDLKRMASYEPEEGQPNKRWKQCDENDVSSAASQTAQPGTEAVPTAHGEGTQEEGAASEQVGSQKNNDIPDDLSQIEGPSTGESTGACAEEPQSDSDAGSSSKNELRLYKQAREKAKLEKGYRYRAWLEISGRFVKYGNNTGFFSKELRKKGRNSRPSMSPEERIRLLEDLDDQRNTFEPQCQNVEGSGLLPKVGLDFMSEFSTLVERPNDAAAFLNIDIQSLEISPESALRLRIDQVQNIAYMVKKAEGILKGCVNANDYGTGKTVEALASIFFLAQRRQACPEFSTHKAAFILCPHQALRGWQETHSKYFSGLLKMCICSNSLPPGEHSQLIDPPSAAALDEFLDTLSPSDPQTSRTVIISTYGELSSPEFLAKREKEDCREKELSLRDSKLTAEALEAWKVAQKPRLFDLNFNPKMIGTLIADEAHEIKHPTSNKAQAAYLLDTDVHFLLTAYPVDNKVSDFRGLLFALYKNKEWQIDWPPDEGFKSFLEMFDDDFDPFVIRGSTNSVPNGASTEYIQALRNGQHLWRLNPHAYRWLGHKMKFSPEFSRRVLGSIFRLCLLRRGVVSVTSLPTGTSTISGILVLPPLSIRTIEVGVGHGEQHYAKKVGETFNFIFGDVGKDKAASAARVLNGNEMPSAAFDNFWDTYLGHITADPGLIDVRMTAQDTESRNTLPSGIKALMRNNTDAGMSFYYHMTRQDTDPVQPPADRPTMIRHLVRRSPKLRWLLVKLEELKQRGQKVIIYCVHPLTQWLVEGVCAMAEFDLLSLRSKQKHSNETRATVINEFNDPSKRHDVLLSTFRILGYSVDLHADCHNMIIFELPDNIPDMLSAIGRIRRVGQTKPQEVSILTMKDSYDDYTLHRQSRKYANAILAFGVLGRRLDTLAWHIDGLAEHERREYLRNKNKSYEKDFMKRIERTLSAQEAVKLLAAGELTRRHLGTQYNRSYIPWHCRHRFLFRPDGFVKMELAGLAGAEMGFNTENGREILHQTAQLPPIGPPTMEVQDLSARLED